VTIGNDSISRLEDEVSEVGMTTLNGGKKKKKGKKKKGGLKVNESGDVGD
jgi:hypothetical protein